MSAQLNEWVFRHINSLFLMKRLNGALTRQAFVVMVNSISSTVSDRKWHMLPNIVSLLVLYSGRPKKFVMPLVRSPSLFVFSMTLSIMTSSSSMRDCITYVSILYSNKHDRKKNLWRVLIISCRKVFTCAEISTASWYLGSSSRDFSWDLISSRIL